MYSWAAVAERTEQVYYRILATPPWGPWERLMRLRDLGPIMGLIMCCIMAVQHWWLIAVQWYLPDEDIDVVPRGWDQDEFGRVVEKEKEKAAAHQEL
jgi:phosphatidylinositol glycan class A protein